VGEESPIALSNEAKEISLTSNPMGDDRANIKAGDKVLLITEDDVHFAPILLDIAHEQGFKGLVALDGRSSLTLAHEFKPSAITLDINLPDINGLEILDYLKKDPETMHIPVNVISVDDKIEEGIRHGAYAILKKPANREDLEKALGEIYQFTEKHVSKLLVVEDDPLQRENIVALLNGGDVKVTTVENGKDALASLAAENFDCMVLDLKLPDMSGFDLLEEIHKDPKLQSLPIVVYTAQEISHKEETKLMKLAKSVILKDVRSPDRLLAETSLFLHRVATSLPEAKLKMLETIYDQDTSLQGKKVLLVDDDMRNIFALTSLLENNGLKVSSAESGKDAMKLLNESQDFDIVLMDIMMPEMDGYETIQLIRKNKKFKKLPIIALTAKAMKGDREKCISVGASDYIPKPVDTEQLISY
jgi:CheY-like chemotaxis protein